MSCSSLLPAGLPYRHALLFIAITATFTGQPGLLHAQVPAPGQPPVVLQQAPVQAQRPPAAPSALGTPGLPAAAAGSVESQGMPSGYKAGEPVTLNFVNAEIDAVARAIGVMTRRDMVIDPRVKGTINMSTERPVSPQNAYNLFLATIRLQGFTVVESAGLYKVVPEADAKLQGGAVSVGSVSGSNSQIQTQIFQLNYENPNNLVPILRPLISPNNTINVNPGNNSLVITDYADNLQRIARIVAALDVSNASDVEIISLKHAIAADLAPLVLRLVESGSAPAAGAGAGQSDTSFKTTLVAEPRSNSLILRAANPARIALVKSLVSKLDQPSNVANGNAGNIYVVHLKNADATKLAVTLRAALSAEARPTTSTANTGLNPTASSTPTTNPTGMLGATNTTGTSGGSLSTTSNQPSTGGQIQADPATNTLIITAPEPQYRQLRAVIDKLDNRRAQVMVESLIVEVSTDKAVEFGIQWQTVIGQAALGTNFGTGASNLATLAANIAAGSTSTTLSKGINLGVAQKVGSTYVLGALARMMDQTGTGNVLSTPNLLTLDNEEAKIIIGQNVPFVTGSYATTGTGSTTANPFQTVERKDVGLTLRVRPQINENGTVKMAIYQEVSSVDASTKANTNGPTTNKRSIESNVLVDDGAIVVLGGLLQDEYGANQEKVPGLGDIPVLGNLFRSESRSRKKTNLMVFLRPIVVRDTNTSDALALDRYDMIRAEQRQVQPQANIGLGAIPDAAVLPSTPTQTPRAAGEGVKVVPGSLASQPGLTAPFYNNAPR